MSGIKILTFNDRTDFAAYFTTEPSTTEEAQAMMDEDGSTDNGEKLAAFFPLEDRPKDPGMLALVAILELSVEAEGSGRPPLEEFLEKIFTAGYNYAKQEQTTT